MRTGLMTLVLLCISFFCVSCSQDEIITTITDGAEAATVGGMLALTADPVTAPFVPLIRTGLDDASNLAINILDNANSTLTLQQVCDLAFSQDPNLAKLRAIVDFCLPILMDISAVKKALNDAVQNIPTDVRADVIAFFTGIQAGLGDDANTTVAQLMAKNPRLKKAAEKLGLGKFNPAVLVNAVKDASVKK